MNCKPPAVFVIRDTSCMTKDRENKEIKHFAADRQKRVHLNDKYKALRSLVPNPTKNDRASIVGDAIMYINELKRTVNELKILVDKKMCCRDRIKRQKSGPMNSADVKLRNEVDRSSLRSSWLQRKTTNTNEVDRSSLRSSWLQRKTTNTEVDVRIVDDEVTVKLVQPKRINCLLFVSKVLDDLQLDLHHVAGGLIGDCYSFLFNSKICEGSTVYAIAIANKLIEIVDTEISPCNTTSTPLQAPIIARFLDGHPGHQQWQILEWPEMFHWQILSTIIIVMEKMYNLVLHLLTPLMEAKMVVHQSAPHKKLRCL